MYLGFTLIKILSWCLYLQNIIPASKTLFAFNVSVFVLLVITSPNLFSLQHAYSQIEPSPNTSTDNSGSSNATSTTVEGSVSNTSGTVSEDFRTLREQYLSSWERLPFSSSFDTFVSDCFVPPQGYGAYAPRASNIFGTDEAICLYVEPVGFGYEEFIDQQGNPLYAYNITADVTVSDAQGSPIGNFTVSFQPENSYRKVTELFVVVEIRPSTSPLPGQGISEFPVGEYTATYHFTDGVKGESFDLVKDFRIGQIAEVR
jgi:hypothetical protein